MRTFRVDRIDGDVTRGEAGSGTVPDGVQVDVKAALPDEPWEAEGDDAVTMRVRVDALEARRVIDEVGEDKVVAALVDGSVDLELGVSSFTSIRSWVLGLLDHATILEPPAFRDELVAWLDAISNEEHTLPADPVVPAAPDEGSTGVAAGPRSAPGAETSRRLRRLLAVIGWLAQVGEAPTAEAAQRFGMDEQELVAELELAACCGTPPYTPDTLMEIEVSEHSVRALAARVRPAAALDAGGGFRRGGVGPLAAGGAGVRQRRVAACLGQAGRRAGVTRGGRSRRGRAGALGRGAGGGGRGCGGLDRLPVRVADELTTRVVEPVQVITIDGHWYLDAYCHRGGDMRRFRVDRIGAVRDDDSAATTASGALRDRPLQEMFVPGPGAVEVQLRLGPDAGWVPESVPVRAVARDGDGVVLDVSGMAWFERLLLQLGPAARVVNPPSLTGLAAHAARRVLARY